MIHLFPYMEKQINSGKTCEEICLILNSVTDSGRFIWFPNAEFTGTVSPFCFAISPRYTYYSPLPVLTGTVSEKESGSVIDIVSQLHIATRIFMAVWNCGVFLFFLLGVLDVFMDIIDGSGGIILILFPTVMIAISQLVMRVSFYRGTRKAFARLRELLC